MKLNPIRDGRPHAAPNDRPAKEFPDHFRWQRAGLCAKRGRRSLKVVQSLVLVSLGSGLSLGAVEVKTVAETLVPDNPALELDYLHLL